jgi:hypothetical protein
MHEGQLPPLLTLIFELMQQKSVVLLSIVYFPKPVMVRNMLTHSMCLI